MARAKGVAFMGQAKSTVGGKCRRTRAPNVQPNEGKGRGGFNCHSLNWIVRRYLQNREIALILVARLDVDTPPEDSPDQSEELVCPRLAVASMLV